jgi:outer membrane lipase/esterase
LENFMAFQWMRRVLTALAPAALLALAACGSGTIESQFVPTRVLAFGDGLTDLGQKGTRYTVNSVPLNDASLSIWAQFVALDYGLGLSKASTGGTDYATGNARIVAKPDAAGDATTPTVNEQIDTFLATNTLGPNDLVLLNGGISDIIVQMAALRAGSQSTAQAVANVRQAGSDLAAQAKRLVAAGAQHIGIVGAYDLGRSPWAAAIGQQALLSTMSTEFNNGLLVGIVDQGKNMIYVDAALLFNLMTGNPTLYTLTDVTTPVCTSVDPGPGIGIGANQVNSALCTTSTIIAGVNFTTYMFADAVYPGPIAQSKLGDVAFQKIHSRW